MASACNMIDKHEDIPCTHTRSHGTKASSFATPSPRPLPSTRRLRAITKQIISTLPPTQPSITGMHLDAPNFPSIKARSSDSGEDCGHSSARVVACGANDVKNHQSSQNTTRLINTRKDCQKPSSASTAYGANHQISHHDAVANGVNNHILHHDAPGNAASHGGSYAIPSNNKPRSGSSITSSSRLSHPHATSNNPEFSHPTSSSNMMNPSYAGDIHTQSQLCIAKPSFPHRKLSSAHVIPPPDVSSTSHSDVEGKVGSGRLANTSSRATSVKGIARVTETFTKRRAGTRDSSTTHRAKELCKNCKASMMESICFIANDGRISAVRTGAVYACQNHHCNVSGCAANRGHYRSLSPSLRKDSRVIRHSPCNPQPTRTNPHALSGIGDCQSTVQGEDCCEQEMELRLRDNVDMSSATGSDTHDMMQELNLQEASHNSFGRKCSEEGGESHDSMDSPCCVSMDRTGLDLFASCKDHLQSPSMQVSKDQEISRENSQMENVDVHSTLTASCISSDIHNDDDDERDSFCRDDVQVLNEFKSLFASCKDHLQSPSMQVSKDQEISKENSQMENVDVHSTPTASCISSDIHNDDDDDDDERDSFCRDDVQVLNEFKSLFYHGDNEYSCSEDGTGATTTPNSLTKGAFDDLSNMDIEQAGSENKVSQPRRSSMAWMRQKYMESLREQEVETVRLRKQEIMARKQAEDWMLDCHMEEMLHKLAPNGKVRVKVLVEAYETVIHHSDSESSQMANHQDHDHLEDLQSYASS